MLYTGQYRRGFVSGISWREAVAFLNRLSKLAKLEPAYDEDRQYPQAFKQARSGYRLPSEPELHLLRDQGLSSAIPSANLNHYTFSPLTTHYLLSDSAWHDPKITEWDELVERRRVLGRNARSGKKRAVALSTSAQGRYGIEIDQHFVKEKGLSLILVRPA